MNPGGGTERPSREVAFAALFFLAVTLLLTWPQAAHMNDALSDYGDAKLNARILQWDFHQTFHDPANLYQLNFFHPARLVLAFSENLWGVSVFGFPLLAAGVSPLTNYNVLLLAGMFLSALSAWALARYVTGDALASVLAGLVFAFLPWRMSQLAHVQFQWAGFLALCVLFLLRYLDHGRRRDAVLFGAAFAWNALCNVHYAIFGSLLVLVTLAHEALQGRDTRRWRGALAAAVAGGLVFVPFALPYRTASLLYGMKRYLGEILTFSGRWTDFLSAGDRNWLYGPATRSWRAPEGDFFPGILPVVLAAVAVVGLRRRGPAPEALVPPLSVPRRVAAYGLDSVIALLALVLIWSHARPGLRLGPVGIGDPGRVQVWLTAFVLVRLAVAFPGRRRRYADLGDWLRRGSLPPRLTLLLAVALTGLLVALGGNTPYYYFLFQSFGQVFRAIRAPARGIVLVHLSLAVLAAWGLALFVRNRSPRARLGWTAAVLCLVGIEYRAFPLELEPTSAEAPAVYRWLSGLDFPGAVVEWPLGTFIYDFDYVFRQAQHQKPLINGYSGFFPKGYVALESELRQRPIPDTVWERLGELGASLLVYHAHETRGFRIVDYAETLSLSLASGKLDLVRSFPHAGGLDFVFVAGGTPWRDRVARGAEEPATVRRRFEEAVAALRREGMRLAPPFGALLLPQEGQSVAPGFWAIGWALDDSGLSAVRVSTDAGPAGDAPLGGPWPGLASVFPDYPEARAGGSFGFPIPDVPPGPHTLVLTLVGKDGGETVLQRRINVLAPSRVSPRPTGPGS